MKAIAWIRRWAFDGVDVMAIPKAQRPKGWILYDLTREKCLADDVPLGHIEWLPVEAHPAYDGKTQPPQVLLWDAKLGHALGTIYRFPDGDIHTTGNNFHGARFSHYQTLTEPEAAS